MTGVPDIAKWLSHRIDLDFEKVSLDNVLKYIAQVLPSASIIVDPDIAAAGIDLSTRVVDFTGKAVAVGDVLDTILGADLAYVPRAGHLLITTLDRLHFSLECKTYTVGVTCRWQELLSIVQRTVNNVADRYVAPWSDEGGAAAIEYGNGVLIVTQTYRGHQRIADLLQQLDAHGFFDARQHADETGGISDDAAKSTGVRPGDAEASAQTSMVPVLCPYDAVLAILLQSLGLDVKETHEELGSLADYDRALFVHSIPVILEMPPNAWFYYDDDTPRPCAWDAVSAAELMTDGHGEDRLWDSLPVQSFAGECERAGKPLALGQWSDPYRCGRDWHSHTGFLEVHQHHDLREGIAKGRFLAVAFVVQVLVDPRFKAWCAIWEQYRKAGEVPVLESEKAARELGLPVPERKTIWEHLPDVIGLNCLRLYTPAALHHLLPIREGQGVDYGPVCRDGIAFDVVRGLIGEPFRNPRPADGAKWLSGGAMQLLGPVGVVIDASGSEAATSSIYGLTPSQVRILPLVISQAGHTLGVAFRVGQGAVLLLPECRDLESKAEMIRLLATELWGPIQGWLQESPVSTEQATEESANRVSSPSGEASEPPVRRTRRSDPKIGRRKMDRLHCFARYANDAKTPQELDEAIEKLGPLPRYWEVETFEGIDKQEKPAVDEAKAVYAYARKMVLGLRKSKSDLPPLPPTETDPFLGLQTIQEWCIGADRTAAEGKAGATQETKEKKKRGREPMTPERKKQCEQHAAEYRNFLEKHIAENASKGGARKAFATSKGLKLQESNAMIRSGTPKKPPQRGRKGRG